MIIEHIGSCIIYILKISQIKNILKIWKKQSLLQIYHFPFATFFYIWAYHCY